MEMKKKSAEILNSPELAAMDGFISKMENLPKLKEVIESAEPQPKWQAMIAGFASQFPGLDKYINEYFGPVLESIGLGFLVKPKKGKEEGKKEVKGKKTEGKKADKKPAESEETPEEEKKKPIIPEGPLDGPEQVPESFRPGKTLITSDSNFAVLEANMHKDLQEILNTSPQEMLSKGSMQSSWGLNQLRSKPAEYFKDLEYAVIGFGSNDLGSDDSAETIWGRLNEIAQVLKEKNPNIKVLMATIPPAKGNTYGLWGSNFDLVEEKRAEINKRIKQAQIDGQIDEVIDLAAKHQEGGLADDKDPSAMAKTFWRHGDRVHAKADALAKAVRRTQYKNSTKAA